MAKQRPLGQAQLLRRRRPEPKRAKGERPTPEVAGSRSDIVYWEIRRAIQEGRFGPGDHLREAAVANWLNVSRTPVREALRRLTGEDLLVSSTQGLMVPRFDDSQVYELYAVREALEGSAAALAAQHASAAELAVINEILGEELVADDTPQELARVNKRLHSAIYAAAHNRYLLKALNSMQDALSRLPNTTFSWPGRRVSARQEHTALVAAITRRDAVAAEASARYHIREALRHRLLLMTRGQER